MKKTLYLLAFMGCSNLLFGQHKFHFGLQTGVTLSTFNADISISNAVAATIPPINEFDHVSNFQFGAWVEKRFAPFIALQLGLQRSPGGAKAFDALEGREKLYKYFYLSTPLVIKFTSFQRKLRFPFELEVGMATNFFLFDYGEEIAFGTINQFEYSSILGISKNIDEKWAVSLRYIRGMKPFSQYDVGGVKVNWTNQMYALTFSRSLFEIGKTKEKAVVKKKAVAKKKKLVVKKRKRKKKHRKKQKRKKK